MTEHRTEHRPEPRTEPRTGADRRPGPDDRPQPDAGPPRPGPRVQDDPRAQDPHAKDPHAKDPHAQDPRAGAPTEGARPATEAEAPLLQTSDLDAVSRRWHDIQNGFVDAPQQAVQSADALVQDLMQRLAQQFAEERTQLESQWSRGDQVSTEDLRVVLQRYRTFFQRLLSVR
jgi:hypothetical protein